MIWLSPLFFLPLAADLTVSPAQVSINEPLTVTFTIDPKLAAGLDEKEANRENPGVRPVFAAG